MTAIIFFYKKLLPSNIDWFLYAYKMPVQAFYVVHKAKNRDNHDHKVSGYLHMHVLSAQRYIVFQRCCWV